MRKIFKYQVSELGRPVMMPSGAHILSAGMQNDSVFVWAIVNPDYPLVKRRIRVYATGEELGYHTGKFVGTVFLDWLVYHVFDQGEIQ